MKISDLFETTATGGTHAALLKQWIAAGTKHPEDPDDRHAELEDAIQASERRVREYAGASHYEHYELLQYDYEIRDVPIANLKRRQSEIGQESMEEMAKQHLLQQYMELHRKHDVLPILLSYDGTILDGYHRIASAAHNGLSTVPALVPVRKGTGKIIGTYA